MARSSKTQITILTAGVRRPGSIAMPLPEGLWGAAAKKAVEAMLRQGLLEEVDANIRRGEPLWRETGDGHGTTLLVTNAGMLAIGIDPVVARTMAQLRRAPADPALTTVVKRRQGTKQAQIIALLQRPEGVAIDEIVAQTGWKAATVRGAISGGLRKKMGLAVMSETIEGRGRVYRCT